MRTNEYGVLIEVLNSLESNTSSQSLQDSIISVINKHEAVLNEEQKKLIILDFLDYQRKKKAKNTRQKMVLMIENWNYSSMLKGFIESDVL